MEHARPSNGIHQGTVTSEIATWFTEPLSTGVPHSPSTKNHLWRSAAAFFEPHTAAAEKSASHRHSSPRIALAGHRILPESIMQDFDNTTPTV
jgi:hypothetical protein